MKKILSLLIALQATLFSFPLFAENEATPPPRDQGFGQTLIMIAIALVFFYLILWRPEQKRRKELDKQRNGIQKGDRVTAMGIIGTVSKVQENTVIVKMYDGSEIEFLKAAISEVTTGNGKEAKRMEKDQEK